MAAIYGTGALPTAADIPNMGANLGTNPHTTLHDDMRNEIVAMCAKFGVEPWGSHPTVQARLGNMLQAPASWTPALTAANTNPNLGASGGTNGRHVLQGKLCTFWGRVTFAGAGVSAGSGAYRISLPFAADLGVHSDSADTANGESIGSGHARDADNAANSSTFGLWLASGSAVGLVRSGGGTVNPASPFVPASGDRYQFTGTYWIA